MEVDSKERLLFPPEITRMIGARKFSVRVKGNRIILEPVQDPESVRGKYRGLLKVGLAELEEAQDKLVAHRV